MSSSAACGTSISGLLGIVFIVLKLLNKIDWPWIWVLAPLWIPSAIAILFILIGIIWAVFVTR